MSDPKRLDLDALADGVFKPTEDGERPSMDWSNVEPVADWPGRLVEEPHEAQARRDTVAATRLAHWLDRLPVKFRDAALDGLSGDQRKAVEWLLRPDVRTLVLRSDRPGVGKSHAAYVVATAAAREGLWVHGGSAADLLDQWRPAPDGSHNAAIRAAVECDLLLVDDLGRERDTEWVSERLGLVVDARWRENKRSVITTNLPGPEVARRYGDAVIDRITDAAWVVEVRGETRRRAAPW